MKATALTVVCFVFLGAIYGCGTATTSDRLNILKDRIDRQDDQIKRLEDRLSAESDRREDLAPRRGSQQAQIDSIIKESEGKYLEDPAPRIGSQQAQSQVDSFIKELDGKSLDELSEREYSLLLAQVENENEYLHARAEADEAITARKRQKTYQMVGCLSVVSTSFLVLWYLVDWSR